jgi:hypothetical protein
MARWTADGVRQATNLMEAAAWHNSVEVVCRYGHRATFDPHGLWWWFHQRGWNDDLTHVGRRFWCRQCAERQRRRIRPARIRLVRGSDADIELPMPPDREWKRVVKRMRY